MAPRNFAALIDQEGVSLLEYRSESGGFRLLDTRRRSQRFESVDEAIDSLVSMLDDMSVRNATLSIVLQHYGSFFHSLALPPAAAEHIRPIIQREVQRAFNVTDAAIAYETGRSLDRPDSARAGGPGMRQTFVAGAPQHVVDAIQARLPKRRFKVDNLTVVPEVFRRLYDALDGSQEVTALLVCLPNGPHIAFFVNAVLELVIEPPIRLAGEPPIDPALIVDQLERGAIFLRQQAHGAVPTRLLLSAPADDFEALESTIEARTGMHVVPLGKDIGPPESMVAVGAVLAARHPDGLDLFPRPPAFEERLKSAMSGRGLVTTTLATAAAVAAFWAAMQILGVRREQQSLLEVQTRVERAIPALAAARQSAQGRERIASIRNALRDALAEKTSVITMMNAVPTGPAAATQLDSLHIVRVVDGVRTTLFGRAAGPSGPAAMSAATIFYRRFKSQSGLGNVAFESHFLPHTRMDASGSRTFEELSFTVSGLSPLAGK
jgi:hypothetical protein